MNRNDHLARLESEIFDVVVIGGGASGLGVAVDAASRGYRTALLEAHDFAKATSSRSTKLVHGGVRYLEQMDFSLVMEALRERGIMYHNAPHLVSDLAFVVPRYHWWEGPFYGIGLKLYDMLAGSLNLEHSRRLNREQTIAAIPNVQQEGLLGGIQYHDGQFDDARMAVSLARTAARHQAAVVNYVRVTGLIRDNGHLSGVEAVNTETGKPLKVRGRVIVNATGIFSDTIRRLDDPGADQIIEPAQGVHLVLDGSFMPGSTAVMVPQTDDGRVLFVIPWHGRVLLGTTDTPMDEPCLEPRALPDEADFILRNANRYLERDPTRRDVLSVFAGQRPLVHRGGKTSQSKSISRSHEIIVSHSGLVTLAGGKWTTYRKMAEDTMEHVIQVGGLNPTTCVTGDLKLEGYLPRDAPGFPAEDHWRCYGSDAAGVRELASRDPSLATPLHPNLPVSGTQVVWGVRQEWARQIEDVLARRTRCLLLDARASIEAAPAVARLMAGELGYDTAWVESQVAAYTELASGYVL